MTVTTMGKFVFGMDLKTWAFGVGFAYRLHISLEVGPFYVYYDLA